MEFGDLQRSGRRAAGAVTAIGCAVAVLALAACAGGVGPDLTPVTTATALPPTTAGTTTTPADPSGSTVAIGTYAVTPTTTESYESEGGTSLAVDVQLPTTGGRADPPAAVPALVLIHGGDFVANDRTVFDAVAKRAASAGFAAFSIDYTLSTPTVAGYPVDVDEALAAVGWVRQNATRFHVDPDQVVLLGSSAGATIAVDAGLVAASHQPAQPVRAAAGWSGAYDLRAVGAVQTPLAEGAQRYVGCGDSSAACVTTATAASPVTHVATSSAPTLLAASDQFRAGCEIVNPSQSQRMESALQQAGVPSVLHVNHQCAHAQAYADVELQPTLDWFRSVLQGR